LKNGKITIKKKKKKKKKISKEIFLGFWKPKNIKLSLLNLNHFNILKNIYIYLDE